MSNKFVKSIEILEDGKLSCILFDNTEVYLQPTIEVDTLDSINRLNVRSVHNILITVDETIQTIDGVAFSGTFADLETSIRTVAKNANIAFMSGLDPNAATKANQQTLIDQESPKLNGFIVNLQDPSAGTFNDFVAPSTFVGAAALTISGLNSNTYVFALSGSYSNCLELANKLNSVQNLVNFSVYSEFYLLVKSKELLVTELSTLNWLTDIDNPSYENSQFILTNSEANQSVSDEINDKLGVILSSSLASANYLLYQNWETVTGNSIEYTYYAGVEAGNPSGAVTNTKTKIFKTGVTTIKTITYTYDINNSVLTITG